MCIGKLPAQIRQRDPHGVCEGIRVLVPHVFEESLGAVDLIGVEDEPSEEGKLLGGEVHGNSVVGDFVPRSVDLDAGDGNYRAADGGIATQQRPDASAQLEQGEGLDEVIVGAFVESADAVIDAAPGGQHDHLGWEETGFGVRRAAVRDLTAHIKAVDVGKVQIEAYEVVLAVRDPVERSGAVDCDIGPRLLRRRPLSLVERQCICRRLGRRTS